MPLLPGFKERFDQIKKLKPLLLSIAKKRGTPLYLFDKKEAQKNLLRLKKAFEKQGIPLRIFFAIKSNPYEGLLKTVSQAGEGLDVSSGRELTLALRAKPARVIYTGPGKTRADFEFLLKHCPSATVNLESFREMELLSVTAKSAGVTVKCGLRIRTRHQDEWNRFGLPLQDLKSFYEKARTLPGIRFCGIQFHVSLNETPKPYVQTLRTLGKYLSCHFSKKELQDFEFLDIGGGFYPESFEGMYPWNPGNEMSSLDNRTLHRILKDKMRPRYAPLVVSSIETFAREIAQALKKEIFPLLPSIEIYTEPGRYIAHSCMHFLMTLVEWSGAQSGITDGSGNMIGWEKYQFLSYVPLFNLTHFDLKQEKPFLTFGSLCTQDDLWGYYLYGKKPCEGDILLMPFQGAYTYTLAQNFIKDIPPVYDLV